MGGFGELAVHHDGQDGIPALAALLAWRFFRTGGRQRLTMKGGAPTSDTPHQDVPAPDETVGQPRHSGNHHRHDCGPLSGMGTRPGWDYDQSPMARQTC